MIKTKTLILGAGPAGLTVANRLLQKGDDDFIVLEKETEAGGLCRSAMVDGSALDIGGGHFLDVRRPEVNAFLFGFMPEEEWALFNRNSKIYLDEENIVDHPLEANIWQMSMERQIRYLKSIAIAGCNLENPMPEKFVDWIVWKLGTVVAEEYMLPYNQKMFGDNLNNLGTYWLEKLPNVSFDETLQSCLEKKAYGKQPGHAQFYYPKEYGYGELWLRMGKALGERLVCNATVQCLDVTGKTVTTADGQVYAAQRIITSIPWHSFDKIEGGSEEITTIISSLKHTGVEIAYHPEALDTKAHWIYEPDLEKPYHRILVRHNFCAGSKGYWTETRTERITNEGRGTPRFQNDYAYPLNTLNKPAETETLLRYMQEHGVIGVGRWGEHEHYNSDVTVGRALALSETL